MVLNSPIPVVCLLLGLAFSGCFGASPEEPAPGDEGPDGGNTGPTRLDITVIAQSNRSVKATGLFDTGEAPAAINWTWGDGNRSSGNPATHQYGKDGTYVVHGTANVNGTPLSAQKTIKFEPAAPTSGIGIGPLPCDANAFPTHPELSTAIHRCIPPSAFTVDGRALGFTDSYDIYDLRPGINMEGCTSSYLLTDEQNDLFLTFSAHCVQDDGPEGDDFCDQGYQALGSKIEIGDFGEVGTLEWVSGWHMDVHATSGTDCSDWDAAIVRLDPAIWPSVHPAIRHVGGPTGLVDVLTLQYGDPMVGYGNSGDRGLAYEFVTGDDTGHSPVMAQTNVFEGYFVGQILDEYFCAAGTIPCENGGDYGFGPYVRYVPSKITGDSGSADLMADGKALGIVSRINFAGGLMVTTPLYDTLLKIYAESGKHYRLVTWDEWSPDTLDSFD